MQLLQEIARRRHLGSVVVDFGRLGSGDGKPSLHDFVLLAREHGLDAKTQDLRLVSRTEALSIVIRVLTQDLAYHLDVMPPATAVELGTRFLALFPEPAYFVTNGVFSRDSVGRETLLSWNPLCSEKGFDTGVMGIAAKGSGILWVTDDD